MDYRKMYLRAQESAALIWPPPTAVNESHFQRNIAKDFPLNGSKSNLSMERPKSRHRTSTTSGNLPQISSGISGAPWTNPNRIILDQLIQSKDESNKKDSKSEQLKAQYNRVVEPKPKRNLEVKLARLSHTLRQHISSPVRLKPQLEDGSINTSKKAKPPKEPLSIQPHSRSDTSARKSWQKARLIKNRKLQPTSKSLPGTSSKSLAVKNNQSSLLPRRIINNKVIVKIPVAKQCDDESDGETEVGTPVRLPPMARESTPRLSPPINNASYYSPRPPSPPPPTSRILYKQPQAHIQMFKTTSQEPVIRSPSPIQQPASLILPVIKSPSPVPQISSIPTPPIRSPSPIPQPTPPVFRSPSPETYITPMLDPPIKPRPSVKQPRMSVDEEKDDGCFTVLHYWLPKDNVEDEEMSVLLV